ncbi:MAG: hypothetical protein IMX05_01485 [Hydrogenibacillus schlegelii]|nr:hypothetical protein [Hydrogenibacillus schlegelii]
MKYVGSGAEIVFESRPPVAVDERLAKRIDFRPVTAAVRKAVRPHHRAFVRMLPVSRLRRSVHARDRAAFSVRARGGVVEIAFGFRPEKRIQDAWYMRIVDTGHMWYIMRNGKVEQMGKFHGRRFTERWAESSGQKMADDVAEAVVTAIEKQGLGDLFGRG